MLVRQLSAMPILLASTLFVHAQDDLSEGITLVAPEVCEIGELVRLDARESLAHSLVWQIMPKTDDFEVVDGGRRAFLSSRKGGGEYLIIVVGAKDDQPFVTTHRLRVKGRQLPPTTLAGKIERWVDKVEDYPEKNAHLIAMAEVFDRLAAQKIPIDEMLKATATANSAVLGRDGVEQWAPFLDELGLELDRMIDAGELGTEQQYVKTWREIAVTLKGIAQ